ncbi:hypothetical protein [Streptomyces sp. TR06-5]|uniref:hypothetical protein n=1 Tax=unclassified Streptomyces TaxID=2593676 RepID=UPI0039A2196A
MTAAGGLALIIIGAVIKYAITWNPEGIDLQILGTILIWGGAAGLLIGLLLTWTKRRHNSGRGPYEPPPDDQYYDEPPRW